MGSTDDAHASDGGPGLAAAGGARSATVRGVVDADPAAGGGSATPSFRLPDGAGSGLPGSPEPLEIRGARFDWGSRTYVMGILNVTPDSFSGDGLIGHAADPVAAAVETAVRMAGEGADVLDVGGESSRPGHEPVGEAEEVRRVVPVVRAVREALPRIPISVDTTKPAVAEAALDGGADMVNDVWGVAADEAMLRLAAERRVPVILMHNRQEASYRNVLAEILADLQRAIERAIDAGVAWDRIVVDPGFGFGKTPAHNIALLRELGSLRLLGRPVLLGASRKSTLGKVLDLPPEERVEATVAVTVLAAAAGVDIVRVHDVRANVRAARMADAVARGGDPDEVVAG
ncbi:MAG TPA: dihydropteroate synthase [Candidatus Dormibacteraeota bacterium]|nr:dihydropteroate synthase [Candidatus Dormibacteraeota bacterium]